MSTNFLAHLRACTCSLNNTKTLLAAMAFALSGCSSLQAPEAVSNFSVSKLNIPGVSSIPGNDASFRPRIYAGAAIGQSNLTPDTSDTVFNVSEESSTSSQFRLGVDLHSLLSVEMNTSLLGAADIAEGENTDVSYTSASVSALVYGLAKSSNRSRREGLAAYGRIGYGLVKHGSIIQPLDLSDNSVLVGLGAEYGFRNGLAARAEVTRIASDATIIGVGGVYRFGLPPSSVGQVLLGAAMPALGAANARTEIINGKKVVINDAPSASNSGSSDASTGGLFKSPQQMLNSNWQQSANIVDSDLDGIADEHDKCFTPAHIAVNAVGCGMFDVVLHAVTFKKGSVWLSPKARGQLDSVASTLLAMPEARIQIRAHTDSDGEADSNMRLSTLRAESVEEYLVKKGVQSAQLETKGMGETQPIDTNETNAGKKHNRRVDLRTLANMNADKYDENAPTIGAAYSVDSGSTCSADCNCNELCSTGTYPTIE